MVNARDRIIIGAVIGAIIAIVLGVAYIINSLINNGTPISLKNQTEYIESEKSMVKTKAPKTTAWVTPVVTGTPSHVPILERMPEERVLYGDFFATYIENLEYYRLKLNADLEKAETRIFTWSAGKGFEFAACRHGYLSLTCAINCGYVKNITLTHFITANDKMICSEDKYLPIAISAINKTVEQYFGECSYEVNESVKDKVYDYNYVID